MAWTQLFIDSTSTTAHALTRAEPLIERWGALPVAPQGTPVLSSQNEYEVRILESSSLTVRMVRDILEHHCNMRVTREVTNEDTL